MQNCLKKGLINIHVLSGDHLLKGMRERERERQTERERKEEGSYRKQSFVANIWECSLKLEDCQRHNLHNPFITTHPTNIVEINNPLESNQSPS